MNSFAPEVIADDSAEWCGNSLRFATEKEADVWVKDLSMRWLLVRETRVVPSDDEPTHRLVQREDKNWEMERLPSQSSTIRAESEAI